MPKSYLLPVSTFFGAGRCADDGRNGTYVVTGSRDKSVCVWNTGSWTKVGECLKGHKSWVRGVAFSPNGKNIASSSGDGTIRLWDVKSSTCVRISSEIDSGIHSVLFTGDGDRVVSGSDDGIGRIWNARLQTESKGEIPWAFWLGECRCDQSRWDAGVFRIKWQSSASVGCTDRGTNRAAIGLSHSCSDVRFIQPRWATGGIRFT